MSKGLTMSWAAWIFGMLVAVSAQQRPNVLFIGVDDLR